MLVKASCGAGCRDGHVRYPACSTLQPRPRPAPACMQPSAKGAAIPAAVQPAKGPAPSRPDLCSSPGQSILSAASLIPSWPLQTQKCQPWGLGPKIPACKTTAAVAAVQQSPFSLAASAAIKTPQGLRQEHTNTSRLAHSRGCAAERRLPWCTAGPGMGRCKQDGCSPSSCPSKLSLWLGLPAPSAIASTAERAPAAGWSWLGCAEH